MKGRNGRIEKIEKEREKNRRRHDVINEKTIKYEFNANQKQNAFIYEKGHLL